MSRSSAETVDVQSTSLPFCPEQPKKTKEKKRKEKSTDRSFGIATNRKSFSIFLVYITFFRKVIRTSKSYLETHNSTVQNRYYSSCTVESFQKYYYKKYWSTILSRTKKCQNFSLHLLKIIHINYIFSYSIRNPPDPQSRPRGQCPWTLSGSP